MTYPDASIGAVTAVDANGDVDSFGNTHTLRGVVTSPDFREGSNGVEFSMTTVQEVFGSTRPIHP